VDIEKKVLLLGILKKLEDENINDVLLRLEEAKVFTLKQGKSYLKELKSEFLIVSNELSFKGLALAKDVEQEFKI